MNRKKRTAVLSGSLAAVAAVCGIVLALAVARPGPLDHVAAPANYGAGSRVLHLTP